MTDTLLINKILNIASERKATDVHLVAGNSPVLRVDGKLVTVTEEQLMTPDIINGLAESFLSKDELTRLTQEREVVTVYTWNERARYRAKVFYQKGFLALSFRVIPPFIMAPKDLGVPQAVTQALAKESGLIIITGPFGSGRTTTAAALLETLNHNRGLHIQTLESPIEYLFVNNQSIIEQRQVGRDTPSYMKGLQAIKEEDVDVVFIGSMTEDGLEESVLELAESGKLVIIVMETESIISALDRFVSNLSPEKKTWGQSLLTEQLIVAIGQRLLPRVGGGMRLACEVLTNTPAVRSSIKDNHLYQLSSIMQTSREEGMVYFDKSLSDLVKAGEINPEDAMKVSNNPQVFKQNFKQ